MLSVNKESLIFHFKSVPFTFLSCLTALVRTSTMFLNGSAGGYASFVLSLRGKPPVLTITSHVNCRRFGVDFFFIKLEKLPLFLVC